MLNVGAVLDIAGLIQNALIVLWCEEIKIQFAINVPRIKKKLPFVIFAA